jgi:hypothetical protein
MNVIAGVSWDRDPAFFQGVFVLPVTAAGADVLPSVTLDKLDEISNFQESASRGRG